MKKYAQSPQNKPAKSFAAKPPKQISTKVVETSDSRQFLLPETIAFIMKL